MQGFDFLHLKHCSSSQDLEQSCAWCVAVKFRKKSDSPIPKLLAMALPPLILENDFIFEIVVKCAALYHLTAVSTSCRDGNVM
jgi:hypothetical protein